MLESHNMGAATDSSTWAHDTGTVPDYRVTPQPRTSDEMLEDLAAQITIIETDLAYMTQQVKDIRRRLEILRALS